VTSKTSEPGELTGRKVAAIFVVFFGVIMAVNFTMASFASSTFGGVVVKNSYVASQKYNGWLAT
jgi:nitrogen fixation protein FixH